MKHVFAAICALFLPLGASAQSLSDVIDDYVTKFDISDLDAADRQRIVAVHADRSLSHGMKVLLVHDVLLKADALEHVNVHAIEPPPVLLSQAE
ncbi:hypothetical protein [Marivita sp.]|uniref:hypothetical protein n=1 Tax=Marivita sp. TaxID=2003365 RepID=UPI0025B85F52|nr:hypothetical protein [Marivita sp.]